MREDIRERTNKLKTSNRCDRSARESTGWAKKTGLFFESLKLPYMLT